VKPQTFAHSELAPLLREGAGPHLTITLPTHPFGKEALEVARTLSRLLDQAVEQLIVAGVDESERNRLLEPLTELAEDRTFWSVQGRGLVLFATPDSWHAYALSYPVEERVVLADRFFIRHLCPLLTRTEHFFVLALSINQVRLLEVTSRGTEHVKLAALPSSMDEALGYEQFYSDIGIHVGGPSSLGRRRGVVHGHGDADEERFKKDLVSYFRRVVDVLRASLPEKTPWVLATVESYGPLFREAAGDDDRLVAEVIAGNPDLVSDDELGARGQAIVDAREVSSRKRALARLERGASSPKTVDELSAVVAAAHGGRVDSLFVASAAEHWGTWEGDRSRLEIHDQPEPGDEELIDAAVFHTLRAGGQVFQVSPRELPRAAEVTALLRY